jgi:di/tricarboxylate transporter
MNSDAWITLGVIAFVLLSLITEKLSPLKALATAALVLFLTDVLTFTQTMAGFVNPGVLTVAALFLMVAALKTSGAIRWLAETVLGNHTNLSFLQIRLLSVCALFSAFVNNTPIVAAMTSAVQHWCKRNQMSPSKLLLPMNYATILGGMCTLLGTSTNIIVSGLVKQHPELAPMRIFDPLLVGGCAALVGFVFLVVFSRFLLPNRISGEQLAEKGDSRRANRVWFELVPSWLSPGIGQPVNELSFIENNSVRLVTILRDGESLPEPVSEAILHLGDTIVVEGAKDFLQQIAHEHHMLMADNLDQTQVTVDSKKAFSVLGILAMMVLANTVFGVSILLSATVAGLTALKVCKVSFRQVWKSMDWTLIAVIAFSFALGRSAEVSGLSSQAATLLLQSISNNPYWALVGVYVMAVLFTEVLTNNAAAVLMFPISLAVSSQLGIDPRPFILAIMIGASCGFITPIGYQTNLMVYGPGGYKFIDYVRLGTPLNIVVGITAITAITTVWGL